MASKRYAPAMRISPVADARRFVALARLVDQAQVVSFLLGGRARLKFRGSGDRYSPYELPTYYRAAGEDAPTSLIS